MVLKALLDTNICIYIARNRPPAMAERFAAAAPGSLGIVLVQSMSADVGRHYGEIRSALEHAGTPIGNNDLWIAAHARSLGTKLITNNMKEIVRVPGLALDCW